MSPSVRVAVVYPDLLGTYGDGGNALVLVRRAQWRRTDAELVPAPSDRALPAADIYTVGGGEDAPQVQAVERLAQDATLAERVDGGAVVLAVCAGFQILGTSFAGAGGEPVDGLGLLDVATTKGRGPRPVGEIVVDAGVERLGRLSGFENHGGITTRGAGVRPLGNVVVGIGNGDGTDGAYRERVVGTYLHGPVLARNPRLADLLLSWALDLPELMSLDDHREDELRAERLADASSTTWTRRLRRRR
jgi:lipid II isoglutaminyl synthase (glutamine-hydrolysing)